MFANCSSCACLLLNSIIGTYFIPFRCGGRSRCAKVVVVDQPNHSFTQRRDTPYHTSYVSSSYVCSRGYHSATSMRIPVRSDALISSDVGPWWHYALKQGTLLDKPMTDKSTETEKGPDGIEFGVSSMQVLHFPKLFRTLIPYCLILS